MRPIIASKSCDFQYAHLDINVVRLAVLADKGVELSLAREIADQILHHLGFTRVDGDLTLLVSVASKVGDP